MQIWPSTTPYLAEFQAEIHSILQEATTVAITGTNPFVMRNAGLTTGKLPHSDLTATTGKVALHGGTAATGLSHSSEEPSENLQVTQGERPQKQPFK